MRYYVFLTDEPFSCDFITIEKDKRLIKVSEMLQLTYVPCIQYSHSAWFLDGRTPMLVSFYIGTGKKGIRFWYTEQEHLP